VHDLYTEPEGVSPKIITLRTSFECESSGIIFVTYKLYLVGQIYGPKFS
jgi:hypothetical protein